MSQHGSSETSSFGDECWARFVGVDLFLQEFLQVIFPLNSRFFYFYHSWFCNLSGNQFYCEIDKAYIEDSFNLFGLKQHVIKDYSKALDTILDRLGNYLEFGNNLMFKVVHTAPSETESDELSRSATLLYGLIHARFIITAHGLEAMVNIYLSIVRPMQ